MTKTHLWLRAETKSNERRVALVPNDAALLVRDGFRVTVEHSRQSIFSIDKYQDAGCEIADENSWHHAPEDAYILGLKELPESSAPLRHRHIYFGHAYKGQKGWDELLGRFLRGGGQLLDLEYLKDKQGRRVAAFGFWAGYAGAALAADCWAYQRTFAYRPYPSVAPFSNKHELITTIDRHLREAIDGGASVPQSLVIGALGRCGSGAREFFRDVGLGVEGWDQAETKKGGPFPEILEHDVFVNCVLTQSEMPPFMTRELLRSPDRRLTVMCDVSCDPSSPYNSLPVYERTTTFRQPTVRLVEGETPLDLIAIDHLPSLLPKESSEDFSNQLLPHLKALARGSSVWDGALRIFNEVSQGVKE